MDSANPRSLPVTIKRPISVLALVELLESVTSMMYLNGYSEDLRPAHWVALRYFRKVNRSAATVLGFARHYGVTKGTASQTVSVLVRRGLLERSPSDEDRRSHFLLLTGAGHEVLERDPHHPLADAVAELSHNTRHEMAVALDAILRQMLNGSRVRRRIHSV